MKISNKNWLYRWAYLIDGGIFGNYPKPQRDWWDNSVTAPASVSLCQLFWRTVLVTPAALAIAGMAVSGIIFLAVYDRVFQLVMGSVIGAVLAGILLIFLYDVTEPYLPKAKSTVTNSVVVEKLASGMDVFAASVLAIKSKFCPIIEIKNGR